MQRGTTPVIRLAGGDHGSQRDDVARAAQLAGLGREGMVERKGRELVSKPWDPAEHLRTEAEIAAHLDAAVDD